MVSAHFGWGSVILVLGELALYRYGGMPLIKEFLAETKSVD